MPGLIREAKPSDSRAIAEVHVASWQSTYTGIVAQEYIDRLSVEERERRWAGLLNDPPPDQCVYVAEEANRVVGFASGGPVRDEMPGYDGELYAIYLLKESQERGIGRRLVNAIASRLHEQGAGSLLVWVLAANPACRFYAALGGQADAHKETRVGEELLDSIGYGWPDISVLAGDR